MKIQIDDYLIGDEESTFIIAEAGINHDGDFKQAKELIRCAAESGADAVKFQIFKADEFCSEKSEYYDLFKSLEFDPEEWYDLAEFAGSRKILFTASVFGEYSADLLERIGSPVYKVASGDLTNIPILRYVAQKNKPIIISTGMSSICEIEEAIKSIYSEGNHKVALMHCVSNYPTEYAETNLKTIQTFKNTFKIPTGFSDHSEGTLIPAIAVALGADIIEKHFTTNKRLSGPDHQLSLDPKQFKKMVKIIRIVEKTLGNGVKTSNEAEIQLAKLARRSLTAKEDISPDEIITKDKISIVRPANGIEPKFLDKVVGRKSKKKISKNDPIKWSML